MVGLAVRLLALGADMSACAPPYFAELLVRVGVPLVPVGKPVRPLVTGATPPPSAANLPPRAAELVAAQFESRWPKSRSGASAATRSGSIP